MSCGRKCWFCGRKLRWASYNTPIEPGSDRIVEACARCTHLKKNMTMEKWADALKDKDQFPSWNDASRSEALRKALKYVVTEGAHVS